MAEQSGGVFLNGRIVPAGEAAVSVFDAGYTYGYGLFETLRVVGGASFRLAQHIARLEDGAQLLHLPSPSTVCDLPAAIAAVLAANGLREARVRISVSLQAQEALPALPRERRLTVLVVAMAPQPLSLSQYQRGYSAIVSAIRRNSASPLARVKSLNYLDNLLAYDEARAAGVDEAVLLNEHGHVACGSRANVFLVSHGRLATPSVASGVRAGVTREAVQELAAAGRIRVEERAVESSELHDAQEALLTNSVIGVMPLTGLDGRPIGDGRPGPLTRTIMAAYEELVERETRR
ncbi:MAG: aminotransferase class IV [Chloroflexi bacterium]|nr:aminotransferase class IV [Chloroflexota bacterium]